MPENYHGNQLKSYGGYLKYNVRFDSRGRPLNRAPDVILTVSTKLSYLFKVLLYLAIKRFSLNLT